MDASVSKLQYGFGPGIVERAIVGFVNYIGALKGGDRPLPEGECILCNG